MAYDPKIPDNSWGPQNEDDALTQWLIDNPDFDEKPATMEEFLGPGYLDIDPDQNPMLGHAGVIRPGVKKALIDIFGDEIDPKSISAKREAMFSGGIGVGKTTLASVALAYCVHWVLCLHDPQKYFGLMPGSRIAFMLMSTKDSQAKEVLFGDIKARIDSAEWFKTVETTWKKRSTKAYDPDFKNQLRFPKEIWVLPGNSQETTFEGYNVLCTDPLTEIFTANGWKKYNELEVGEPILTLNHETGLSEWKPVERINVFDGPSEMVLMEGSEFSSLTTDGHRWPVVGESGDRRWKTTATLGPGDYIQASTEQAEVTPLPAAAFEIKRVPYDDIVWCPTVENSTWLARRNGSVHFTGNCGILDEGDSHKVTENKDYAAAGWRTIKARVTSRFTDPETGKHRGLLIAIGQMKKAEGFMATLKRKMEDDEDSHVAFMAIWESIGWEKYRNKKTGKIEVFWYDIDRRIIVPPAAAAAVQSDRIIKIPISYQKDFELDPVQALKDHAGIPPHVDDPFIGVPDRVREAQESWMRRHDGFIPVVGRPDKPAFHDDFGYPVNPPGAIKRALHVDIAYAANGDALGMAMGHIPEMIEVNGEIKPVIVFDFLLRLKPSGGQQLMLSDFRKLIFELRDERKFKIGVVSFDGFQSLDSVQILREKRFNTAELSVDRTKGPYEELREAIYERRIEFPPLNVYLKKGDVEKVNIVEKELLELTDTGRKIDHPPKNGSKDVADAMAGVVWALMSNDQFRRGAKRAKILAEQAEDADLMQVFGERTTLEPEALGQGFDEKIFAAQAKYGLPPLGKSPFAALRRSV